MDPGGYTCITTVIRFTGMYVQSDILDIQEFSNHSIFNYIRKLPKDEGLVVQVCGGRCCTGSRSLEKGEKERKGIAGTTESPALVC